MAGTTASAGLNRHRNAEGAEMSTTIGGKLREQLRDVVGSDHTSVQTNDEEVSVTIDIERCERYAIGIQGIHIAPAAPRADVAETADRIAKQVDAIEHLRVIEFDQREGKAILRTAEPEADEGGITYWEATVQPVETTLNRYHKAHTEPDRQRVVEPITHRQLGELADQLADAVRGEAT